MPFYTLDNREKALALALKQRADGWTDAEIRSYWYALNVDFFLVKWLKSKLKSEAIVSA